MRWFSPQRMKKHLAFALAVSLVAMVPVSAFAQVLKISIQRPMYPLKMYFVNLKNKAITLSSTMTIGKTEQESIHQRIRRSDRNRIERSFQKLGIYLQDCRQSDRSVYSCCYN